MSFWKEAAGRTSLSVRLTPKAAEDRLDGLLHMADGTAVLAVRVRAVPEKGRANEALLKLLARELGVPRSRLALVSGGTARRKTVALESADETLRTRLAALAGAG